MLIMSLYMLNDRLQWKEWTEVAFWVEVIFVDLPLFTIIGLWLFKFMGFVS